MIDYEDKAKVKLEAARNSYVTKEEFINIINTLEFEAVRCADIKFITGFIYEKEDEAVIPLTKNIEIS